MVDVVSKVMDYEAGEMEDTEIVKFFSEITKSGLVFQLQGSYQRALRSMIEAGYLASNGDILRLPEESEEDDEEDGEY